MKCTTFTIDSQRRTCACGAYQINGIFCKHVIPCITIRCEDATDYVDPKLTIDAYISIYLYIINPLPDKSSWPIVDDHKINPPEKK